jgi:mannose-6-phosphate isomerase-like protein (cupin superfamily)
MQAKDLGADTHLKWVGVLDHENADMMRHAGFFRHAAFLPSANGAATCFAEGMEDKINLGEALESFEDQWAPRNVATVNDYDVRVVHIQGEFVWHAHDDTDELFQVLSGDVQIHLRDRTIELEAGDIYVVPKGVEHKPASVDGASMLLFEPSGTTNTGSTDETLPDHIQTTAGVAL